MQRYHCGRPYVHSLSAVSRPRPNLLDMVTNEEYAMLLLNPNPCHISGFSCLAEVAHPLSSCPVCRTLLQGLTPLTPKDLSQSASRHHHSLPGSSGGRSPEGVSGILPRNFFSTQQERSCSLGELAEHYADQASLWMTVSSPLSEQTSHCD
jgi:hypothetical protein